MRVKAVRKGVALAAMLLVVGGVTSAATSSGKAGKAPYNLGIVVSLSGTASGAGQAWSAGTQDLIKYMNSKGGVNGRKIAYKVYDDRSSVTAAAGAAQQALSGKPNAILDGTVSTFFNLRMPTYASAQIPVISDSAIAGFYPWRYSDFPTVAQNAVGYVNMMSTLFHGSIHDKRVAFVFADAPGTRSQVPPLTALLKQRHAEVVDTEFQTIGAPSFTSGAANVVAAKPDAVFISDTDADGIVEAKALIDAGYKGVIISNYGAASLQTMQTIASPQYHAQYLAPIITKDTLAYQVAKKYGTLDQITQVRFAQGWSAAYVIIQGLKKCGYPCSSTGLEKALDSLGSVTIPGGVAFAPYTVSPTVHNMLSAFRTYTYSKSKKALVADPGLLKLGPPNY
jgi:branched-chain amino acid transport system substrate-binding protein